MIGKFMDWMLSPLTRRVRREVEAAIKKAEDDLMYQELRYSARIVKPA